MHDWTTIWTAYLNPMRIKEGEEQVNSAKYAEGVLIITIPIENTEKNIPIQ